MPISDFWYKQGRKKATLPEDKIAVEILAPRDGLEPPT